MTNHHTDCDCNYCKHVKHCVLVHDELVEALENFYNISLNAIPENEKEYKIILKAKKALSKAKANQ